MKRTKIKEIYSDASKFYSTQLTLTGWIRKIRDSKAFGFIELNDGSYFKNIQIVLEADTLTNYSEISKLNIGTSIKIYGTLIQTPNAKQDFELKAEIIEVLGNSTPDYPLQNKKHSFEYLRTISHLRPRTNTFLAVFKVRSIVAFAIHKFFQEKDFTYVHTPIITGSDCEGAGQMFKITTTQTDDPDNFFGKPANLTVSGQLNAETFAMAFGNVYTFGPTFRAENSNTARHASEFWMIEPEMAFTDLSENMDIAEEMIKYIIHYTLQNAPEEMQFFNQFIDKGLLDRLNLILNSKFERLTYTKAIELLTPHQDKFKYPVEWGCDLQTEHERFITEEIFKKPVFVIDYPKKIKAFYMRLNEDKKTVAAMDLLVPGVGEIIGGSQREERFDMLSEQIKEFGINEDDYSWYIDTRRFGSVEHSGYGLGFERMIMYITGMSNIRDVIPFPRVPGNADF